jgi:iron complex outermembrane receptor protein
MMNQRALMLTCAFGALALSSGGAFAATAAAADTSQSATSVTEVIVTAEKRSSNIQSVPETVTAFTAKDRALKGINTVQDMTNFTPGFTYSSQLDRPAMRGLSRNNNIYLSDSSVAVYYDDVFSNSTFFVGRDDMLIDQVEILIGPQGTLYGRNAIGGLINTISRRPTSDYSAEVRAMYGNYGYSKVEGTVSGPIAGNLTFRVSVVDTNQDRGYLNNVANGSTQGGVVHDPYVDAQLQYKDDKNEVWFDAYQIAFHNDRGGPGGLLGIPTAGQYATGTMVAGNIFYNPNYSGATDVVGGVGPNPTATNLRNYAGAYPTNINLDEAYNLNFHFIHHFDGFDIKYVAGYGQYHYNLHTQLFGNDNSSVTSYQIPLDPSGVCSIVNNFHLQSCGPLTVYPEQVFSYETHTKWYSNEITVSSTTNNPLQYIAGIYSYTETDNNLLTVQAPSQAQLATPTNEYGPPIANPNRYYYFTNYEDRIDSEAAYGQLDWKVTPTIKLTGGLRFTYDRKSGTEQARFINFGDLGQGSGKPGDSFGLLGCSTLAAYSQMVNPLTGATDAIDACVNAANLGTLMPAIDITPLLTGFGQPGINNAKGVTCAQGEVLTGYYAGDFQRCLGDHSSALTGTAGVEWTPDRDTLVYARYNRGYKAFGLNAGVISANPEAEPEHVNDYELGIKKTFGHSLTIDLDGFYYDYSDDQVPLDVPTGGINLTQFLNVPKAVSEGIEFVGDWRPIDHLDLSLTYALDHTSISSNCTAIPNPAAPPPGCYIDGLDSSGLQPGARDINNLPGYTYQSVKGNQLPQAPQNKVAFNATYTIPFEPGNLILSGTFVWKDKSYASVFERSYYMAPSWNQVDLRATWSGDHDRYEIVAYVKNVFNSYGYDAAAAGYETQAPALLGGPATAPVNSYDLTPPRLYGVEVHYKF